MRAEGDTELGAAILGMYAAIKIVIKEGVKPEDVLQIVKPIAERDADWELEHGRTITREDKS